MWKRVLVVLFLLGAVFVVGRLGLSSEVSPVSFYNIHNNLDDGFVDVPDLHMSVHTPPEVYVNHPFTVTATISSPHPLTSLRGSDPEAGSQSPFQGERLDDLLRPASYTGSYAVCLKVDLQFDNESAFGVAHESAQFNTEQEFTLVQDVTTAQTAQWTGTPQETYGFETVPHEATVLVWFDAETTCRLGNSPPLGVTVFLGSSSSKQFTVVNEDLIQQRAITAHLQPRAVAAVAVVSIASVGWAAGFFEWVLGCLGVRRKRSASETVTSRSAATRSWFIVVVRRGAPLGIGMVLIMLGPTAFADYLGTDLTLASFFSGIVVACVGIVFLACGVRRNRFAYSA